MVPQADVRIMYILNKRHKQMFTVCATNKHTKQENENERNLKYFRFAIFPAMLSNSHLVPI